MILRVAAQLSAVDSQPSVYLTRFSLIVQPWATMKYPEIAKLYEKTPECGGPALLNVRVAFPDRDLAGFDGIEDRLTVVIFCEGPIPDALREYR